MGLSDDANPAICSIGEDRGESLLGSGMEVELRFLKVDELAGLGGEKGNQDGKHLGDAEADVSDVDKIAFYGKPAHEELDLGGIDWPRANLTRQP